MAENKDMTAMVQMVKIWLRKSARSFDGEIEQTILSGLKDLARAGVRMPQDRLKEADIQQAIKLYSKANFGFGDPEGKWQARYETLRDALALEDNAREVSANGYQ